MFKRRSIVWFRSDLRLHDNEALTEAIRYSDELLYLFVFDNRIFRKTNFGFPKTGIYRTNFLIESVRALKENLNSKGADLMIRVGKPEEIIPELAAKLKTSSVFCNRERTSEEVKVQNRLEKSLWSIGQEVRYFRGKMLIYTSDLSFPVTQTPDIFTQFRKEVENMVFIREPLPVPEEFKIISDKSLDYGTMPEVNDLIDGAVNHIDGNIQFPFKGGENNALKRLESYIWETESIKQYKETRNGLLGINYSTKFSPFLSNGSLSPKKIYHEILRFEALNQSNDSTYWLKFELLWRDFFRFMAKKHGNAIFQYSGSKRLKEIYPPELNMDTFNKWIEGKTGVPFIDANMRELKHTGYMSNRGRQNVASFFINELNQPWLAGAAYFESILLDYDPASNYGNWNYLAGVGSDPRHDRHFNVYNQSKKYDPEGEYIKFWCPELNHLKGESIHEIQS